MFSTSYKPLKVYFKFSVAIGSCFEWTLLVFMCVCVCMRTCMAGTVLYGVLMAWEGLSSSE